MRPIAAAALVIIGFLASPGIGAQGVGAVAGVVKDKSGAVLPGVTVQVTSVALIERVRTAVTDASGQYRLVNLPAGLYIVRFSLPGFSPVTRIGVEVAAGLTTAIDAEMAVGAPNKTVTVPSPWSSANPGATLPSGPYVLCGLTILPGNPRIDPKIRRSVESARGQPFGSIPANPSGQGRTEYSMRRIAPQICAGK